MFLHNLKIKVWAMVNLTNNYHISEYHGPFWIYIFIHTSTTMLKQHNLHSISTSCQKSTFFMSLTAVKYLVVPRDLGCRSAGSTDPSKLRRFPQQFHWNVIVRALCPPQSDMRDLSPGPLGLTAKHNDTHTRTHTQTHTQSEADESHFKDYSCV